jgi:hypothetical protein
VTRAARIVVFLNNKLIACDTVVPLMIDLAAQRRDIACEFVVFEERTHDAIRQNIVLHDAIRSIGRLSFRGRRAKERGSALGSLRHRLSAMLWLVGLTARALAGRVTFIHFKALNQWPLRLLGTIARRRTIFMEPSAIGYAPLERQVSEIMRTRRYKPAGIVGRYLVGFSDYWDPLGDERLTGRIKLKLPPPYRSGEWQKWLHARAEQYLGDAFRHEGMEPRRPIAVFILTWMGPNGLLAEPDLFPILFEETLDALADACPQLPIFLKPHPAMRAHERSELIERVRKRTRGIALLSDLHPMVLGQRACFAIGNCYSTTFSVLRALNVPTIEYTDYKPSILAATSGGSMRPEFVTHFIQRDRTKLRSVLRSLAEAKPAAGASSAISSVSEPLLAVL